MNSIYALMSKFFSLFLKFVPQSIIDKVGADKVQHFFAGFLVGFVALVSHLLFGSGLLLVLYVPAIIGVVKELLDYILNKIDVANGKQATHGVDFFDALATALGGVAIFALYLGYLKI